MKTPTLLIVCVTLLLAACAKKPEEKKSGPPPTLITTTQVRSGSFEVAEETLGTLEALVDPRIGAEVAGKIVKVLAVAGQAVRQGETLAIIDAADFALQSQADHAEVKRLEALLLQQDKLVERQQGLVAKGFISQNAADDAKAQRAALAAQLAAARARAALGSRSVGKTTVTAPASGVIENQFVAPGDYVKLGDPLFQLIVSGKLRAHLPFPEAAAQRLRKGQAVKLSSPEAPGKSFAERIGDIRPSVAEGSRAIDVLVDFDNAPGLRPGGTVNATVEIAAKSDALLVPEQSVVLRPAGKVVYAIVEQEGQRRAQQRVVQVGAKRGGQIEILAGIAAGETVALDGAGFLTHGAAVTVKEPGKNRAATAGAAQPETTAAAK